jgi:hypothetical protein
LAKRPISGLQKSKLLLILLGFRIAFQAMTRVRLPSPLQRFTGLEAVLLSIPKSLFVAHSESCPLFVLAARRFLVRPAAYSADHRRVEHEGEFNWQPAFVARRYEALYEQSG